ncbi:MAG TPA: anti-sigma factor [Candidatus Limnocylindrales bacterium]
MTDVDPRPGGLGCAEVADQAAAYALGALEPADAAAIRTHVAACPNPHPELAEMAGLVAALGETVPPMEPPSALRNRILASAAAAGRPSTAAPRAVTSPRIAGRPARPWFRPARASWTFQAAAVIAILALGAWNLVLQGEVGGLQRFRDGVTAVTSAANAPGSVTAVLSAGGDASAHGVATIRADGTLLVAVTDLAPTTGAQVYEAWLIPPGGAPVPAGSFTVAGDRTGILESGRAAPTGGATIALTREAGPGATTPTLPIVSSGTTTLPSA